MREIEQSVKYFEDAVKESDEIIADCSEALKKELTKQKEHFVVALAAIKKQTPIKANPLKKIPGICRCPICKVDLCIEDGETQIYCPDCGQAVII